MSLLLKGSSELCMRNDAQSLEEARWAHALRSVDDLRRDGEVTRPNLFAKRAYGGERDDEANAQGLQGRDVCSSRDFGWRDRVSLPMASEESDERSSGSLGNDNGRAGFSPRLKCREHQIQTIRKGSSHCIRIDLFPADEFSTSF